MDSIMDVTGIGTHSAAANSQVTGSNSALGKEEFLKLLITQLRHQDPLNPMEGTEFASQLAQFNSVEQLISLNAEVGNLVQAQDLMSTGLHNSLAATLTGKSVKAMSEQLTVGQEPATIHYWLQELATTVKIEVKDASGNVVRTEELGNLGEGDHQWQWDGTANDGRTVLEGEYTVAVSAGNGEKNVNSLTFMEGTVERVRFTGNGVRLLVNGVLVPLSDVEEIGE